MRQGNDTRARGLVRLRSWENEIVVRVPGYSMAEGMPHVFEAMQSAVSSGLVRTHQMASFSWQMNTGLWLVC